MNQNYSVDQLPDCEIHNRTNTLICPSCLMYGPNKGDQVISKEEAIEYMRNELNQINKDGLLKTEYCDNTLLDIRHNKLSFQDQQTKIIKEIENNFADLIKAVKSRKNQIIQQINQQFETEVKSIQEQEDKWMKKEEITQRLIDQTKCERDLDIVCNSKQILDDIANLREHKEYQKVTLLKNVYSNFQLNNETKGINELKRAIDSFIQEGETINIQYRS